MISGEHTIVECTSSGLGSLFYALPHIRRTLAEKRVIQTTNAWVALDELQGTEVDVTVAHAMQDELISFEDSARSAEHRPWINFISTDGDHSNIYNVPMRHLLVNCLSVDTSAASA